MSGAIIEAVEHRASLQRDMADRKIFAHERLDRVEMLEPHQSLELDFTAEVTPHQVDVAEAGDVPRLDGGNHFAADDPLISVSILRRRPAAPEPADHSYPHGHEHIKRVRLVILAQQGRRCGVGEMDLDRVAVDLAKDVEQVAGVEPDLEPVRAIVRRYLLG